MLALVGAAVCRREIRQRDRIEVVVGEDDEAKALAAQLDDLAHNQAHVALARLLPVGAPDRTERAVLRAAADGLHRGPHVAIRRQQIPSRGRERITVDPPAGVERLRVPGVAVVEDRRPDEIAVPRDDGVGGAMFAHFVREERGVNAADTRRRRRGPARSCPMR